MQRNSAGTIHPLCTDVSFCFFVEPCITYSRLLQEEQVIVDQKWNSFIITMIFPLIFNNNNTIKFLLEIVGSSKGSYRSLVKLESVIMEYIFLGLFA